jgi:hypothetical protein
MALSKAGKEGYALLGSKVPPSGYDEEGPKVDISIPNA